MPLFQGGSDQLPASARPRRPAREGRLADLDNAAAPRPRMPARPIFWASPAAGPGEGLEAAQVSSCSALLTPTSSATRWACINIDVLNAQSQLFDTQQKLAKARYDTLMAPAC